MKQILQSTLVLFAIFIGSAYGQTEYYNLNQNNINATLSNNGLFFNQSETFTHGYEVPTESGLHAIYSLGFWFSGVDINGNIKMSAQMYTPDGDQFRGPLTTDGSAEAPASSDAYGVYPVTKMDIDYHIDNYDEGGYEVPESIMNWPAHGDESEGIDFYLAPFVDMDGNGLYEPENGDYPQIKGDEAAYIIMNDKGGIHETGSDPIGLELHYLIYQYNTGDYLNDVTFMSLKVINRGTQTLSDFRVGCFSDLDLGNSTDDYIGVNVDRNMMYVYNADNIDETGYETNPPALGVSMLNHDAGSFACFSSDGGPRGLPSTPVHFYNYMNGYWKDGTHFVEGYDGYVGEGPETNFLYNGDPNDPEQWSQVTGWIDPGDRRGVLSSETFTLNPGDELCFDYAVMYTDEGFDNMDKVVALEEMALEVESYYAGETPYCASVVAGVKELAAFNFEVYPNPSTGVFQVQMEGAYNVNIFSLDGRTVLSQTFIGTSIVEANLNAGTYILQIMQGEIMETKKIIIH